MEGAVDEQRRRAAYLAGRRSALDVSTNALEDAGSLSVVVEPSDVEPELIGVALQVGLFECLLAMEEQLVHLPEAGLACGRLSGSGGGEGVWMDLDEREMAVGETDLSAQFLLDAFDLSERQPRVGAFVVAVLDDQATLGGTANVIDRLVQAFQVRVPRRRIAVGVIRSRPLPG